MQPALEALHTAREGEHRNIPLAAEEERRTGPGERRRAVVSVQEALRTAEAAAVRMALVAGDIGLAEAADNSHPAEGEDTGPVAADTGPEEAGSGLAEEDIGPAEEADIGRSLEAALRCVRLSTEVARGQ